MGMHLIGMYLICMYFILRPTQPIGARDQSEMSQSMVDVSMID